MALFGRKYYLGLDIGEQTIKLVQVQKKGARAVVTRFTTINTPEGAVSGGIIIDSELVAQALFPLVDEWQLDKQPVTAAVTGQQVFTKLINMPTMKTPELRQASYFQASSFLPMPIEEVAADIIPIREFKEEEESLTQLFFIAARRNQIDNLHQACGIADLNLTQVSIKPLAWKIVYNAQMDVQSTTAVLNIGTRRSHLAVYSMGRLLFMRPIAFDLSAARLDPDQQLMEPPIPTPAIGSDDHYPAQQEVAAAWESPSAHPLAALVPEITRSLDYFDLQNTGHSPDKMIVSGNQGLLADAPEYLAAALGMPVELAQLNPHIIWPREETSESQVHHWSEYATALGLAVSHVKSKALGLPSPINLLTYKLEEQQAAKGSYREYIALGLVILLLAAGAGGLRQYQQSQIAQLEQTNQKLQTQVDEIKQQLELGIGDEDELDELGAYRQLVQQLGDNPNIDPDFLDQISMLAGADIVLAKINAAEKAMDLSAYTNQQDSMINFIEMLQTHPQVQEIKNISSKTNEDTGEIDFSLKLSWGEE